MIQVIEIDDEESVATYRSRGDGLLIVHDADCQYDEKDKATCTCEPIVLQGWPGEA